MFPWAHESPPKMTSQSVQPVLHTSLLTHGVQHTDKQTDTQTMLCTTSVAIGHIYTMHAMWPKRHLQVMTPCTPSLIFFSPDTTMPALEKV